MAEVVKKRKNISRYFIILLLVIITLVYLIPFFT